LAKLLIQVIVKLLEQLDKR